MDRTMEIIKASQPNVKFSKTKRILFTDEIIKAKKGCPPPGQYTVNDSKIYKVMAKSRR